MAYSLLATLHFGFIHQGGVLPSLVSSHSLLSSHHPHPRVVSWKTFGLPRALLPPDSNVTDLAGSSPHLLVKTICAHYDATVLFAPMWASPETIDGIRLDPLACVEGCGVHVDVDRMDEVWREGWRRSGMGVWQAECTAS